MGDVLGRLASALIGVLPGLLAGVLPGTGMPLSAALLVSLVGVATLVALAAAVRVALVAAGIRIGLAPSSSIDDADRPTFVAQSDPDADGHARPRAPAGRAATVGSRALVVS